MGKRDNQRNTHRMGRYGYAGSASESVIVRNCVGRSRADAIRLGYAGHERVRSRTRSGMIGVTVVALGLLAIGLLLIPPHPWAL